MCTQGPCLMKVFFFSKIFSEIERKCPLERCEGLNTVTVGFMPLRCLAKSNDINYFVFSENINY